MICKVQQLFGIANDAIALAWHRRRLFPVLSALFAGVLDMPAHAEERFVLQKLGAHTYAIPRDILESISKPDYSREPNPNPSWPRAATVRLVVQAPDFTALPRVDQMDNEKRIEIAKRKVNIDLRGLESPILGVDGRIENLRKLGVDPQIGPATFGLRELRTSYTKNFRQYIATSDDGQEFLIHCSQLDSADTDSFYLCNSKFSHEDLYVQVNFTSIYLPDWQALHRRTITLINSMRRT